MPEQQFLNLFIGRTIQIGVDASKIVKKDILFPNQMLNLVT